MLRCPLLWDFRSRGSSFSTCRLVMMKPLEEWWSGVASTSPMEDLVSPLVDSEPA
jgi:hypothetical protein